VIRFCLLEGSCPHHCRAGVVDVLGSLPRRLRSGARDDPNQTNRNVLEAVHIIIQDNYFPVRITLLCDIGVGVSVESGVRHWLTFSVRRGHAVSETGQPVFVPVLDYCTMSFRFRVSGNLG